MDHFDFCFDHLLKMEGGFVNDKADRGGATKFGVTIKTLSSYMNREATIADVQSLTLEDARRIYRVMYWEPPCLNEIQDRRVACALFDQAVNRGPVVAIRNMQKAVNKNLRNADLNEDGKLGIQTTPMINAQSPMDLVMWFVEVSQLDYVRIVEFNESQLRFLRGWISRTHALQRLFWDP